MKSKDKSYQYPYNLTLFLRERERPSEWAGMEEGQRRKENLRQAPHPAWSLIWGSISGF